ncbi:hypothetical protein [Candidatus Viadribacter manganicus]|uniref:Uncharacterized protein n=1 Tax=Candidatus Viadribacter manganicus TaxID=1759059 RepID=A0A1B1AEQ2_9PROT|nr:hypothetical protein [Candidatus Viadribacter manganicus]ANP45043.1 hypothetical protein ATE48_03460 [Candidatus Viadribacter manganicus]
MAEPVPDKLTPVAKRYAREMLTAGVLYSIVVFAGAFATRMDLPHWVIVVAAIVPIFPALLMLRAYITFVNGVDEFQRRIQSEAVMIAAGVTGFGCFTYGFLEEWAGFPHLPLIWVLPILIGSWGVALCFVRMKYK